MSDRRDCPLCGAVALHLAHAFDARPEGETDFGFAPYRRELWNCAACGHVVNRHDFPLARLYAGSYMDATYGDRMAATFARIMALPGDRSDNRQRVKRVNDWAAARGIDAPRSALDIGSGLGVFPAAMGPTGWACTAIDPDPRAAAHIEAVSGARALCGDFLTLSPDGRYDMVCLNKVLEHVEPMAEMLALTRGWLSARGAVYVELPDGEAALQDSPAREEFFVEHFCAFSIASVALLGRRAGLRAERIERLREPSGKYTLAALMVRA